jgi:hypothetical protein
MSFEYHIKQGTYNPWGNKAAMTTKIMMLIPLRLGRKAIYAGLLNSDCFKFQTE